MTLMLVASAGRAVFFEGANVQRAHSSFASTPSRLHANQLGGLPLETVPYMLPHCVYW
jgi:hypothetical protein